MKTLLCLLVLVTAAGCRVAVSIGKGGAHIDGSPVVDTQADVGRGLQATVPIKPGALP